MLTISGQVDQGASDNKGMRLYVAMVDYSDGVLPVELEDGEEVEVDLTYDTSDAVVRVPGSTTITGTATSGDGVHNVSLTL